MPAWLFYPSWTRYNLLLWLPNWDHAVLNLFLNKGLRMRLSMSLLDYTNSIPCPWGKDLLHIGLGTSPSQGHLSLLHKTQHSYPRSGEIQWFNILWWWTTLYQELTKLFGGNFECEHVWQTLKTCDTECFKKACITKMFCTHTRKWMVHTCSIVYEDKFSIVHLLLEVHICPSSQ